jgi:general stress protein 26
MATVPLQGDGAVWLLTKLRAPKVGEVEENHRVNLNYISSKAGRYVSLSGTASLVRDPQRVADLWKKRHRKWFPEGKNDPELALLRVQVERAEYWDDADGKMVVFSAQAAAPSNDEPRSAGRIADAMKALVTGTEDHASADEKDKPPTPGGAQG